MIINLLCLDWCVFVQVKKRQQRVIMILDSRNMLYNVVDITEPGKENEKAFMQANSKTKDGSKTALPPQIFNGDIYCGVSILSIVPKFNVLTNTLCTIVMKLIQLLCLWCLNNLSRWLLYLCNKYLTNRVYSKGSYYTGTLFICVWKKIKFFHSLTFLL